MTHTVNSPLSVSFPMAHMGFVNSQEIHIPEMSFEKVSHHDSRLMTEDHLSDLPSRDPMAENAPSFFQLLLFAYLASVPVLVVYILIARAFDCFTYSSCHWDCGWYLGIAAQGYDTTVRHGTTDNGQANWAFFPAFPMLVRGIAALTHWSEHHAALVLNNGLFPLMATLTARYAQRRAGVNAFLTVLLFIMMPFSLYFHVPLSETLYGTLMIALLLLLQADCFWLAAGCAVVFTATRPTGAIVLALIGLARFWQQAMPFRPLKNRSHAIARSIGQCMVLGAVGGIGLFGYMAYLHVHMGDALAFMHIEAAWGRHSGNPLAHILYGLRSHDLSVQAFLPGHAVSQRYLALCCVGAMALIVWGGAARLWLEAGIVLITLLLATSTGLWSIGRYLFANPVTMLLLASVMQRLPARWQIVFLGVCAMIQVVFVTLWYQQPSFLM
ncbi:hypothetical protein [Kozakia baliensis]|uniref:hypothetical protein n=1 Tax=Kozakia baliensis TaxID=153496 RepID=UPI001268BB2E|nr:hypothetical protein [Kozakia baliensis]